MGEGFGSLRTGGLMLAATFVAPAFAPGAVMFVLTLSEGDPAAALLGLLFAPFLLLSLPGMFGYTLAFAATLLLGLPLTALAFADPTYRPFWVWSTIGALAGTLIGVLFARDFVAALAGAGAGMASAFVYRCIIIKAFDEDPVLEPV